MTLRTLLCAVGNCLPLAILAQPDTLPTTQVLPGIGASVAYLVQDGPRQPEAEVLNQGLVAGHGQWSVYSGNTTLDGNGQAVIKLPDYFKHLHLNERLITYHLTPYDRPLNVYLTGRMQENQFSIRAQEGIVAQGVQVGWLVMAQRTDTVNRAASRPSLAWKTEAGIYVDTAVYQYYDVLDFTEAQLDALLAELTDIATKRGWAHLFSDACVVGSFAQGAGRGAENPDPSDLDIAFVLDTVFTHDDEFRICSGLKQQLTNALRLALNDSLLTFDFSLQTPSAFPTDNPAQIHFSLRERKLYGRSADERLYVKLVRFNGKMFRFDRSRWMALQRSSVLSNCDLSAQPNGLPAYVQRGTGQVVLPALPNPNRLIVAPY
jgi:hypothetical protein